MGIVNGDDYQIVYSDTPGILKPNYRLQKSMMDFVDTAIGDADIILYVTDTVEKGDKNDEYIAKLKQIQCPVILVINKIDISNQEQVLQLALGLPAFRLGLAQERELGLQQVLELRLVQRGHLIIHELYLQRLRYQLAI